MSNAETKAALRPLYSELQGYLNQVPGNGEAGNSATNDETLWVQFNATIDELNEASGVSFEKFKVTGIQHGQLGNFIKISEIRMKLGGLIARLHGTYFSDEPAPFSGMPSTTINVSNQQEQNQHQTMIAQFATQLDAKIEKMEASNEKSFLTELRDGLSGVADFVSLTVLISELGTKFGIGIDQIGSLIG